MAARTAGIDTVDPARNVPPAGFDSQEAGRTFMGHPPGLFLLFFVEMWERFSYYGMRALLVLYLIQNINGDETGFNPGRGWSEERANTLYGWYTGLAYLFPVVGGIIADKFIGTHRSMVLGGIIIALGHVVLAVSGFGDMAHNELGMAVFIGGLALIILGTGHFKPCVSTMVGQLYKPGDPRRDGGFSIFYMGINLGAFLCAFVCGTLGEVVGWHWGFGSAAVGMILGLIMYVIGRPFALRGIGLPPAGKPNISFLLFIATCVISALVGYAFFAGAFGWVGDQIARLHAVQLFQTGGTPDAPSFFTLAHLVAIFGVLVVAGGCGWFVSIQRPGDKGPTASIFLFMLFNAFFWIAFEQAGSTMNVFAERSTDRAIVLPEWFVRSFAEAGFPLPWPILVLVGAAMCIPFVLWIIRAAGGQWRDNAGLVMSVSAFILGAGLAGVFITKAFGQLAWVADFNEIPATWFQSVNAGFIILCAPMFAFTWAFLGRRNLNPTQPMKIALGLILLGIGFIFLVIGAQKAAGGDLVSPWWLFLAYFWHTMGELCLSPTGLSYVTKAAPVRFVSLLMGIWFISSFIANLGGGLIAAKVEAVERGEISLPWNLGGRADFFMLFVVSSLGVGILVAVFTPLLKKMLRSQSD